MNPAESLRLTRYVKAGCPHQAFDEYTPDAWHDLLADLRFVDCMEAAKAICQREPFCAPAEIRAEVRRIRSGRIAAAEHRFTPPPDCEDYQAWLADMKQRAGDGEYDGDPEPMVLTPRDMAMLESAFPKPPKHPAPPEVIHEMRRNVVGKGPAREEPPPEVDHRKLARDAIDQGKHAVTVELPSEERTDA